MDLKLRQKTALVTGSTAGIGLAIAQALIHEGAAVIINGRTEKRVKAAVDLLRDHNRYVENVRVSGIAADLGTAKGVARLIKKLPTVDILVNNLGIFEPKPFVKITDADWFRFFEVNVMSGVRLSRHYLPQMMKRNWGRVIFISSESGLNIPAEMIHYGLTKTAQLALARGLAETTVGTQVTVNSVLPGPTRSEGVSEFVGRLAKAQKTNEASIEKEFFKTMRPSSLLQRFATPDEVAAMVVYLCGVLSSATNGAALRVDGGVLRSMV